MTLPITLSAKQRLLVASLLSVVVVFLVGTLVYVSFLRPPQSFPAGTVVTISDGRSLVQIAEDLERAHVIRSPFWFTNFVIYFNTERKVVGGEYYFDRPVSVYSVARIVSRGMFNMDQAKTTIPEGSPSSTIVDIIKKSYPEFDGTTFLNLAQGKEGYLFPDTYKFGANVRPEKVVELMSVNFQKKISSTDVTNAIEEFGKPLDQVITMASILEGEARQTKTRQIVAGILWKRIKLGIPLQVDATFRYINGKTTENLTQADLKIDSPYNTYLYKGLPPTPISNPGLDTIMAAVTPLSSDYIYFLTDKNGVMHYAATFEEHVANKRKYLR